MVRDGAYHNYLHDSNELEVATDPDSMLTLSSFYCYHPLFALPYLMGLMEEGSFDAEFEQFLAFFENDRTKVKFSDGFGFFPSEIEMTNGEVSQITRFEVPIKDASGLSLPSGFALIANGSAFVTSRIENSSFALLELTKDEEDEHFFIPFDSAFSVRYLDQEAEPK